MRKLENGVRGLAMQLPTGYEVSGVAEAPQVLTFDELTVTVGESPRSVLVARPQSELLLDRPRLERMQDGDFGSKLDQDIVAALASREPDYSMVIFNARDEAGNVLWGFDPDLEDEQRMEFGWRLLSSQIALYRQLIEQHAGGLVGVGFGSRELAAFQRGTVRVVTTRSVELESAEGQRAAELETELWLIEHAARWTGLTLDEYVEQRLAQDIATCEAKRSEIEALLSKLA